MGDKILIQGSFQEGKKMNEKAVKPFGLKDKIGYMFGDFGNDFTFIFSSTFLMVFYMKVLGISGAAVGTLFLVARFVDAFTDVTMGRIVDTCKLRALRPQGDRRALAHALYGPPVPRRAQRL